MLRVGCGRKTITNRVLAPKASFFLPLQDSGSGAVNTTEFASGATPTFTRATTATTFNSSGTLITVGVGIARSYYDPTTLAYLGYLAEGASTNLALHSASIGGTSWTTASVTVTLNTKVAPDGQTTGDTLAATSSACKVLQPAINSAATYTFSCYMMRSVGSGAVTITTDNVTSTDISASLNTTAWVRVQVSKALAAGTATFGIGLGVTSDAVFVWGAQFEQRIAASSYLPTVASTVARNADVLSYPSTNINLISGSAYAEFIVLSTPDFNNPRIISDGAGPIAFVNTNTNGQDVESFDGTLAINTTNGTGFVSHKGISKWGGSTYTVCRDGLTVVSGSWAGFASITNLAIGGVGNSTVQSLYGCVKNIKIFRTMPSDSVLQQLTT